MIELLMEQFWDNVLSSAGTPIIAVLVIMVVLFFAMLYCGLEFDYALVILSPIPYAFYQAGYLEVWISALFIIIPLGVGIWSIWVRFKNK